MKTAECLYLSQEGLFPSEVTASHSSVIINDRMAEIDTVEKDKIPGERFPGLKIKYIPCSSAENQKVF